MRKISFPKLSLSLLMIVFMMFIFAIQDASAQKSNPFSKSLLRRIYENATVPTVAILAAASKWTCFHNIIDNNGDPDIRKDMKTTASVTFSKIDESKVSSDEKYIGGSETTVYQKTDKAWEFRYHDGESNFGRFVRSYADGTRLIIEESTDFPSWLTSSDQAGEPRAVTENSMIGYIYMTCIPQNEIIETLIRPKNR